MLDIRQMKFTEADDPEIAEPDDWHSYLGLPTPQYLQIFRTNFPLNCRMTKIEAKNEAHDALERHVYAINRHLMYSKGSLVYTPPYEDDQVTVGEGSAPTYRKICRQMYGWKDFSSLGLLPGMAGEPGIIALRNRALHLMNPWHYETCEGYTTENAVECSWISEVALGFDSDKRHYYRGFQGFEMDALLNWDLSEFNG